MRRSFLVAMASVSVLVAVGSPAFATPNLTDSSGSSPVAPFITPIGTTRSQFTGRSSDSSFFIPTIAAVIECRTAIMSGYVGSTHTRARITSLSFGNRSASDCDVRVSDGAFSGVIVGDEITCLAAGDASTRPWFLHVTSNPSGGSATVTLNVPPATAANTCTFTVRIDSMRRECRFSFANEQSIRGSSYTNGRSQLVIFDNTVQATSSDGPARTCGIIGPVRVVFRGTYTFSPDTATDKRNHVTPTITAAS
jgi:hypothetical protein